MTNPNDCRTWPERNGSTFLTILVLILFGFAAVVLLVEPRVTTCRPAVPAPTCPDPRHTLTRVDRVPVCVCPGDLPALEGR